jgi:hypothetical protein
MVRAPLKKLKVDGDSCFWTNAVGCYAIRKMSTAMYDDAAVCCYPRLEAELLSLNKDVKIAALGKQAQKAFNFTVMYRWERQTYLEDRWAIALVHPAALLRDPKPRQTTDFLKGLKKVIAPVPTFPEAPEPWVVYSTDELPDVHSPFFSGSDPIVIDLETSQVSWRDDAILLIGIGISADHGRDPREVGTANLILTPMAYGFPAGKEWLELFFRVHGHRVGGHNFKFDAEFLNFQSDVPAEYCKTEWDTILMAHAHSENWASDLKTLVTYYFDAPPYEKEVFNYLKKKSDRWTAVPQDKLIEYLCKDLHYNLMLYHTLREELQELTQHELRGVCVNMDRTNDEIKSFLAEEEGLTEQLSGLTQGIIENPNSTKQCSHFVYDILGAPKCKVHGLTARSTAKAALDEIQHLHPSLNILRHFRRVSKLRSSYLQNILKYARIDYKMTEELGQDVWRTHKPFRDSGMRRMGSTVHASSRVSSRRLVGFSWQSMVPSGSSVLQRVRAETRTLLMPTRRALTSTLLCRTSSSRTDGRRRTGRTLRGLCLPMPTVVARSRVRRCSRYPRRGVTCLLPASMLTWARSSSGVRISSLRPAPRVS